ncbi:hypothetical protein [Streptosporangium sp. NPDC049644]
MDHSFAAEGWAKKSGDTAQIVIGHSSTRLVDSIRQTRAHLRPLSITP